MINIAWLESIALMTDHDPHIDEILQNQTSDIRMAYQSNDQAKLNNLLGDSERLASRNTIFQI